MIGKSHLLPGEKTAELCWKLICTVMEVACMCVRDAAARTKKYILEVCRRVQEKIFAFRANFLGLREDL